MKSRHFDLGNMVLVPPHVKKVIYLDQFAISEMVKVLDRRSKAHARTSGLWRHLFEKLDRLCKLQLVVCPWSPIHHAESLVSDMFQPLRRMYEHLANGVEFCRPSEIELRQLNTALSTWLDGKAANHDLNPERVTVGPLHEWSGRFVVSVSTHEPAETVSDLRLRRERLTQELSRWFDGCRRRTKTSFDAAMATEVAGYRQMLLRTYDDMVDLEQERRRLYESASGKRFPSDFDDQIRYVGPERDQVSLIREVMERRGIARNDAAHVLRLFLESSHFADMPVHAISARIFAAIAHAAANHQKRPPDQGTANDITLLSAYLPYCDAMFIDRRMRALWEKGIPKKHAMNYKCRLFSPNIATEFVNYLELVESEADPFVVELVREAYGENWPEPFLSMFDS